MIRRYLLLFLILFAPALILAVKTEASTYVFQQQSSTASTTLTIGDTANPIIQTAFTFDYLNEIQISALKLRLKYETDDYLNQIHTICVAEMLFIDPVWNLYFNNPAGCFRHNITASDISAGPHDVSFIGSSITLAPNVYYGFFDINVATTTTKYAINAGRFATEAITYYGSTVNAYGDSDTIPGSLVSYLAFYLADEDRAPIGTSGLPIPANNGLSMYDLFFIIAGSASTSPALGYTADQLYAECDTLEGLVDNTLCRLNVALFTPFYNSLALMSTLWDEVKYKPPFGYWAEISHVMADLKVGTTTLAFGGIAYMSWLFDPLRVLVIFGVWLLLAFWIFHRLRNLSLVG